MNWLQEHLVDDLSLIWRRWSVKIAASQLILIATWAAFSAVDMVPAVPDWIKAVVVVTFSAAAVAVSPFRQANLPNG